ncbi:MAG: hypothetical protein HQ478_09055 [Chloroflexi bacterium]|nr:hypothetical protein [Chloroflexota bacterium]
MLLAITPDELDPLDHPVREIKAIVEHVLMELSALFERMYSRIGRLSIPPELNSSLLAAGYNLVRMAKLAAKPTQRPAETATT